jgi:hypothetical protein
VALLAAETIAARARRYATPDMQLAMRSTVGPPKAPPLRLVLLGDSTALGVGVDQVSDTVGGQLAALLAEGRAAVGWSCPASRSPARTRPTWAFRSRGRWWAAARRRRGAHRHQRRGPAGPPR